MATTGRLVEDSGRMWWTDDGDVARPPIARDADTLLRNAYCRFCSSIRYSSIVFSVLDWCVSPLQTVWLSASWALRSD